MKIPNILPLALTISGAFTLLKIVKSKYFSTKSTLIKFEDLIESLNEALKNDEISPEEFKKIKYKFDKLVKEWF